jgi:hypothetical protein
MMKRRSPVALGLALAVFGVQIGWHQVAQAAALPGTAVNFTLVGHNALFDRGMNAAPAIFDHYIYIGSRTDGDPSHGIHTGVQIVDIADPTNPVVVGQIPLPTNPPMTVGYTSRELRVWPQQKVLMVLYFGCSALIHACTSGSDSGSQPFQRINFFDLSGTNAAAPVLTSTYTPSTTPHEMFLWADPKNAARALLFWTSPNTSSKQLVVTDLSSWRTGTFPEIATLATPPGFGSVNGTTYDLRLHSLSVTPDGMRGFLAYLGGGVLVIDTAQVAAGVANPTISLITPVSGRAFWDNQGAHSSVQIPSKPYILTTEEIYGNAPALNQAFGPAFGGCPWGWVRIVDMSDPTNLRVVSEFRVDENQPTFCPPASQTQEDFSSYASHNPTVLPDVAIVTWHSGGLRAIDLTDPTHPTQGGFFVPTPETLQAGEVHTTDPALEPGSNGTIGWSYPIIRNGFIYYIDIANGLYIVKYTGPHADEVNGVTFLEGNSNLGDAARLAGLSASTPEAPALWPVLLVGGAVTMIAAGERRRRRRTLVKSG